MRKFLRLGVRRYPTANHYQDGYATAELAMTMPILFAIAAVAVWIAHLGVMQMTLQSKAGMIARDISRGSQLSASTLKLTRDIQLSISHDTDVVRVSLSQNIEVPLAHVTFRIHAQEITKMEPDVGS